MKRLVAAIVTVFIALIPHAREVNEDYTREEHMVDLTNHDRIKHERDPLKVNWNLSRYAKRHSRKMREAGYIFHSTERQMKRALEDVQWSEAGENVGVGASLFSLERAFMRSPPHRQNILNSEFNHIAVGVIGRDPIWVTIIFYG